MVRRVAHEVGVERVFPYHSPSIAKVEVTRRGRVRRARLYYLRHKSGKASRIKESFDSQLMGKKKKKPAKKKEEAKAQPKVEPTVEPKAEEKVEAATDAS